MEASFFTSSEADWKLWLDDAEADVPLNVDLAVFTLTWELLGLRERPTPRAVLVLSGDVSSEARPKTHFKNSGLVRGQMITK